MMGGGRKKVGQQKEKLLREENPYLTIPQKNEDEAKKTGREGNIFNVPELSPGK